MMRSKGPISVFIFMLWTGTEILGCLTVFHWLALAAQTSLDDVTYNVNFFTSLDYKGRRAVIGRPQKFLAVFGKFDQSHISQCLGVGLCQQEVASQTYIAA